MLQGGGNIHGPGMDTNPILHLILGSSENQEKLLASLEYLLKQGIDVNATNQSGNTGLHIAAITDNLEALKMLLAKGANPNILNSASHSPLIEGASFCNLPVYQALEPKTKDKSTALHYAALNPNLNLLRHVFNASPEAIKRPLLEANKAFPLHLAVCGGKIENLKFLLEQAKDLDPKDQDGFTPLHLAVEKEWIEGVRILLKAGASTKAPNTHGITPLAIAETSRNQQLYSMLQLNS